jgi:predicted aspartyl protease
VTRCRYSQDSAGGVPALIGAVAVAPASGDHAPVEIRGVIDTGADVTSIPLRLVDEWRLTPAATQLMTFANADTARDALYAVHVVLEGWPPIEVYARVAPFDVALVGLDVLENGLIVADGPRATLSLIWKTSRLVDTVLRIRDWISKPRRRAR